MSRNFHAFDENSAPTAARAALAGARKTFGFIPPPLARYAASPLMLQAALSSLQSFEHSSLAPLEQEVLALTVAHENGCRFCVAVHRRRLASIDAPPAVAEALSKPGVLPDARLEALRRFVLDVIERRGDVGSDSFEAFIDNGFERAQALDVVLGVGAYTITTFANRLTETSEI
ncbi:MAG: carboxymuconolactone decarboxylase family protein [Polyangiaceae bacterium]